MRQVSQSGRLNSPSASGGTSSGTDLSRRFPTDGCPEIAALRRQEFVSARAASSAVVVDIGSLSRKPQKKEKMSGVTDITTEDQFAKLVASRQATVVHFWAPWAVPCLQLHAVFAELAQRHPGIAFARVEAEELPDLATRYGVESVPHVTFIKKTVEGGTPVTDSSIVGADVPAVVKKVDELALLAEHAHQSLRARLEKLIHQSPVMLFMKGTPDRPQCGFSRQIVELLRQQSVQFDAFNILSDEDVRQGLKDLSNWPTYPQLYAHGKLVGGLDVVKELISEGELSSALAVTDGDQTA